MKLDKGPSGLDLSRYAYPFRAFAVSTIAIVAAWPASAWAQAAPDDKDAPQAEKVSDQAPAADNAAAPTEELVVVGVRRGIADSITIKKNQTSIVEVVAAEDLGKLPDVSIAESIARLPGLAAQRVSGRAQVITIRGLSPDFTTTLLNGRQQASSGDNRAVEFDQYPSELLGGVVVYKTPDASVDNFGLAGTVDLRTVKPLDFNKRTIALNLRGEVNSLGKVNADVNNKGIRYSGSYVDQFFDGKVGVALGYAHLDSPENTQHYKTYFFANYDQAIRPANSGDPLIISGQEFWATSRDQFRDAWVGIFELKPNDHLHSEFDVYYSKFNQQETTRGAQFFSSGFVDGVTYPQLTSRNVNGTQLAVSGTATNVVPILRNDFNTRRDKLIALGWNTAYTFDALKVTADLGFSRNIRNEQILETYAGFGISPVPVSGANPQAGRTFDTLTFSLPIDSNGALTGSGQYDGTLDYADANRVSLGDRAPWGGWGHDGAIRFPRIEETLYTADLEGKYDLAGTAFDQVFSSAEIGFNYTDREKNRAVADNDLFLKNNRAQRLVPSQFLISPTDLGFAGFGPVLSFSVNDPNTLAALYNVSPILDTNNFNKNFSISEQLYTYHFKADINSGLFGLPLRGNVGVQLLDQRQSSTGILVQSSNSVLVPIPTTSGAKYLDVLPSLNLIYGLAKGHEIRFGVAREAARPRVDDLRASFTAGFDVTSRRFSGSAGNPQLRPWRATAVDLSYTWYAAAASYISVAGYYKRLNTYIFNENVTFDFNGVPLPTNFTLPAGTTLNTIGTLSRPENGQGGNLYGVEISGAVEFGKLTKLLDGFGFIGSWSYAGSDVSAGDSNNPVRIPGLSGRVRSLTAYYEKHGFQARIGERFRSAFKGEVQQLFATRGFTEILPDRQVDAQFSYTFQKGFPKGLGLLFQVNNLADSPYRTRLGLDTGGPTFSNGGSIPETYDRFGRQFIFGINYRF